MHIMLLHIHTITCRGFRYEVLQTLHIVLAGGVNQVHIFSVLQTTVNRLQFVDFLTGKDVPKEEAMEAC